MGRRFNCIIQCHQRKGSFAYIWDGKLKMSVATAIWDKVSRSFTNIKITLPDDVSLQIGTLMRYAILNVLKEKEIFEKELSETVTSQNHTHPICPFCLFDYETKKDFADASILDKGVEEYTVCHCIKCGEAFKSTPVIDKERIDETWYETEEYEKEPIEECTA